VQNIPTSEIRDRIFEILRAPNAVDPEDFYAVAVSYADLVTQINRRVSICNQWIDAGLRSEAVHLASLEPDLLEEVGRVDLGDSLDSWTVLCEANSVPIPPPAKWELASYLNEAWEIENRLKLKLQDLRFSMLQHDSIAKRIEFIQKLRSQDSNNPVWDSIQIEHEVKRIEEIQEELDSAIKENNLDAIGLLKTELLSADWLEPPPIKLINQSIDAKKSTRKAHVNEQFERVANKLFKAMSEGNIKKAKQLAEKWEASIARGLTAPTSALEEVIPVFEWLENIAAEEQAKDEFENSCEELLQALDNQVPVEELEVICNRIERLGFGVPAILENRYKNRYSSWEKSKKQKNILKILVGSTAIVAVVALVIFLNQRNDQLNKINQFQAELSNAIEQNDIGKISAMLETNDELILAERDGILIIEWNDAVKLIDDDESRADEFLALLRELSKIKPIRINDSELKKLSELARTSDENVSVKKLKELVNGERADYDALIQKDANIEIASIEKELGNLEEILLDGQLQTIDDDIKNLIDRIFKVEDNLEGLFHESDHLKGKVRRLNNNAEKLEYQVRVSRNDQNAISGYEQKLYDEHSLSEHMNIIEALATYEHDDDIKRVVGIREIADDWSSWGDIYEKIPSTTEDLFDKPELAKEINNDIKSLTILAAHDDFEEFKSFLHSISEVTNSENHPNERLRDLIGEEGEQLTWTDNLERIVTRNGNYYGKNLNKIKHTQNGEDAWKIRGCILTIDDYYVEKTSEVTLAEHKYPKVRDAEPEDTGYRQWKANVGGKGWLDGLPSGEEHPGTWHLLLLKELMVIEDMEATVRLAFASRIAKMYQDTSWHKIEDLKQISDQDKLPEELWFNPDKCKSERASATNRLKNFNTAKIEVFIKEYKKSFEKINIEPKYTFIGHLNSKENERIAISNVDDSMLKGNHSVFALTGRGTTFTWHPVGKLNGHKIELNDRISDNIPFGTPLFMEQSERVSK